MTIKDLNQTAEQTAKLFIITTSDHYKINRDDELILSAIGDYAIEKLTILEPDGLAVTIKTEPVKQTYLN